jgi:hypothetical protein
MGVTWAAGPAATAIPLTLKEIGFPPLFFTPAAKSETMPDFTNGV